MAPERIYGFHPVREALRCRPHEVAELWFLSQRHTPRRNELEELAKRHRVAIREGRPEEFGASPSAVHNGFGALLQVAAVDRPSPQSSARPGNRDPSLILLLEDVQDPRNLGAVLRVAEATGVGRVLLRDRGSAPVTPLVAKASAGASQWLDLERIVNPAQAIARLKSEGFWVYGAATGGIPPWQADLTGPVVLCLGGEHHGLRARTRSLCDVLVGLPMRGRVDSLNLSTAAAALLYEALRQRVENAGKSAKPDQ